MLLYRQYRPRVIDEAFKKIKLLDHATALQRVNRMRTSEKLTFVIKYDPRLPSVPAIVNKHFKVMRSDPYLDRVFQGGVQVAYGRYKNLRDLLCRSRLPPVRPKRVLPGWRTCLKRCIACVYSANRNQFKCTASGKTFKLTQQLTCSDQNVIYIIQCKRCLAQYVGKTSGAFKTRINQHRNSIGKSSSGVARHFEQTGHKVDDFSAFVIERVAGDAFVLGVRERFWIDTLDVICVGMNSYRTNV